MATKKILHPMNPRSYRVNLILSPLDFPSIMGLGQSSVSYQTEPPYLNDNKLVLTITKKYILVDISNNKEYEVISVQSMYEVPSNEINNREDVYEFYKDATLSLNEAYQFVQTQLPSLPTILFPNQPIANYQREIDRIFDLLNSQN